LKVRVPCVVCGLWYLTAAPAVPPQLPFVLPLAGAAIIAGLVSTTTLAAHTVIALTAALCFMPILGFGVAVGIRVGQLMGGRAPVQARVAYRAVLLCTVAYAIANAVLVTAVRGVWGSVFTDDSAVDGLVSQWLWMLSLYTAFDSLQCVASGVLRGLGRPGIGAVANVISWMCVGLPAAYALCVPAGWGLAGIWAGFTAAVTLVWLIDALALARIDWGRESEVAWARAGGDAALAGGANPKEPEVTAAAACNGP